MSTRATYRFTEREEHERFRFSTTIYIHTDGYPTGAATYFYEALSNPSKGDLATQFIRAIASAELTKSPEVHGDTEYHYEVEGYGPLAALKAYKWDRDWRDHSGGGDTQRLLFDAPLHEFIHAHHEKLFCDGYSQFRPVKFSSSYERWLNQPTAARVLDRHLSLLRGWAGKFNDSHNWKSTVAEVGVLLKEFPLLRTAESDALTDPQHVFF